MRSNLDPPGMQGSAAQWLRRFLLGFQHEEDQSPQKVTLQVDRSHEISRATQ